MVNDCVIGGFSGDTMVCTSPGVLKTFKQLVEDYDNGIFCNLLTRRKDHNGLCYSSAENPRITKKDAELLKITFKNKEYIKCTPDYIFMLNNFEYKKAKDLTSDDVFITTYDDIIYETHNEEAKKYFQDRITVESVEYLDKKEDVYNITVPETHNFALFGGIYIFEQQSYFDIIIPSEFEKNDCFWRLYPTIVESNEDGKFVEIKWGDNKIDMNLDMVILLRNDLNKIIDQLL